MMMCALMAALKCGDVTKIENIIATNTNIDQQDENGFTALQLATQHGYYEIVKSLLVAGADPNIKNKNFTHEVDANDVLSNNKNIFADNNKNLIDNKNLNSSNVVVNNNNSAAVNNNKNLTFENILQELQDLGSVSALHIAVKFGYLDVAKLLLMYGADPNILDSGHCTPLHWAAVKGLKAITQLLLENKADPNIQDLAQSTALHEAVRKSNLSIMRLLLEKNANPNLPDIAGDTACKLASENKRLLDAIAASSKYLPEGFVSH